LHLTSSGAGIPKINTTISALRFFFNVTLDRPDLSRHLSTVHKPRKVPVILSPDEMARFLDAAPCIKYKAAFSVAYGAGLRVSEVASLKVDVTYLGGIERGRRNRSLGAVRVEASS
jgi:integrase/recombinase XerD